MLRMQSPQVRAMACGALVALWTAGCATKAFVRKNVDPIDDRLGTVEEATARNESDIRNLEAKDEALNRDISRVDERALGAQGQADSATNLATEAGREAEGAHELARDAQGRIDELKDWVENIDNFEAILSGSVAFGLSSSELTQESKTELDTIAGALGEESNYVVEVRGFTDTSGSAELNLRLSRERADAVVRYMTATHEVPLFRIHTIGLGSETPVADNKTRDGRRQNRRVEVTVYKAKTADQIASH